MITGDLKRATIMTALNDMVRKGYFSVCTVDRCAEILGISLRGSEPYRLLSALHCIHFNEMPRDVRNAIPEMIRECLNIEPFPLFEEAVISESAAQKKSIWNRLLN